MEDVLREKIASLEGQLAATRGTSVRDLDKASGSDVYPSHQLLLLADSALPLGSFAFSSGLESYLAHHSQSHNTQANILPSFLSFTLKSLASSMLPYLITAYNQPRDLQDIDDTLDACILCPVMKRASVAQGRALLTLWERAFRESHQPSMASEALLDFSYRMRAPRGDDVESEVLNAHFPPIWATVCRAMSVSLRESAYAFFFNQAKAVLSAGVRASVVGPYAAQSLLASAWLKGQVEEALRSNWDTQIEDAGQSVPMLDLWIGRHELLYSRIFNS